MFWKIVNLVKNVLLVKCFSKSYRTQIDSISIYLGLTCPGDREINYFSLGSTHPNRLAPPSFVKLYITLVVLAN